MPIDAMIEARPVYWKHKRAHGFHYAAKQLHFQDRGSALRWVCEYHPSELTEAQGGWADDAPLYSWNIWSDIPAALAQGPVEAEPVAFLAHTKNGRFVVYQLEENAKAAVSSPSSNVTGYAPLFASPPEELERVMRERDEARAKLEQQCDNIAFLLNHGDVPGEWYDKFSNELAEARAQLAALSREGGK